ncbi:hypothetical protein JKP88DRAFT_269457 [Tribonema minus]|uniref:Uncharacterized protein n=1 Tax=Tribonema minus TaxID=303371 RepID=A0A835Z693_9STRA|nr:hypothetical protein JKP88DRAFT_269457 [Tribonema minus]
MAVRRTLCLAAAALACSCQAFNPSAPGVSPRLAHPRTARPLRVLPPVPSVEESESPRDTLIYDARTGRFYEKKIEEICRDEYCAIDETTGEQVLLTLQEKERIFLDAIQSFYYSDRQILEDDDFEKLKEDLIWEGSDVVMLNRQETVFLYAMQTYLKGEPFLTDEEFDALKQELRDAGSKVAVSTEPKCYIDTGICTVTFQEDKFRRATLYTPVGIPTLLFTLGALYEVFEPLRSVNPLVTLILATIPTWAFTKAFTDSVFITNEAKVAYGPCPSCGATNHVFFGNVLGVVGPGDTAEFKCSKCKEQITIRRRDLRARTAPSV